MEEKMIKFHQDDVDNFIKSNIKQHEYIIKFEYIDFEKDCILFQSLPGGYYFYFHKCKFNSNIITHFDTTSFIDFDRSFDNCIFSNITFYESDLSQIIFEECTFINVVFYKCIADGTSFTSSYFIGDTNFIGGNYFGCSFPDNLKKIAYSSDTIGIPYVCPKEGSFIGYKKAYYNKSEESWLIREPYIVKLLILEDAKRSSSTSRKCRCDKAKVLSITNLDGTEANIKTVYSGFNEEFSYTVGETIEVKDFDECRWNECAPGIHFWMDRLEAVEYYI